MKRLHLPVITGMLVICAVTVGSAWGREANEAPGVGDAAPNWSDVVGTDGTRHGLAQYEDAKLLALVFTCNGCPVSQSNETRVVALQHDYAAKGVQVVAVNVNHNYEDTLEAMKTIAKEHEFNFPYLFDLDQNLVRDYGVKTTLHVFVLDPDRRIAYIGALDDSPLNPSGVKKPYVRDAIDALLAGKKPPVAQTKPKGCKVHAHPRG